MTRYDYEQAPLEAEPLCYICGKPLSECEADQQVQVVRLEYPLWDVPDDPTGWAGVAQLAADVFIAACGFVAALGVWAAVCWFRG